MDELSKKSPGDIAHSVAKGILSAILIAVYALPGGFMKHSRKFTQIGIVFFIFVCCIYPLDTFAWTPPFFIPGKDIPAAGAVFIGRVVSITEVKRDVGLVAEAKIDIVHTYRGINAKEGDYVYIRYNAESYKDYPAPVMEVHFTLGREVLFVLQQPVDGTKFDFDTDFQGGVDFALEVPLKDPQSYYPSEFLSKHTELPLKGLDCWYEKESINKSELEKLATGQ